MHLPETPSSFEGHLSALTTKLVAPLLPRPDALIAWTEALLAYHRPTDAVLILRGSPRGEIRAGRRRRVVFGDNTPGTWCYLRALDGAVEASELPGAIERGRLPIAYAIKADERSRWTWPCTDGLHNHDKRVLNERALKHCHILPVGDRSLDPVAASLRNLCPLNHFLFPAPRKHDMRRLGWQDRVDCWDLGESDLVLSWVRFLMLQHIGPEGRRVAERFNQVAGGAPLPFRPPPDVGVRITRRAGPPASGNGSRPSNHVLMVRESQAPADRPTWRTWTLDVDRGEYFCSSVHEQVLWLRLLCARAGGSRTEHGHFRLDLDALVRGGFVQRIVRDERSRFLVRIVRDHDGTVYVARPKGPRAPLASFAVPHTAAVETPPNTFEQHAT